MAKARTPRSKPKPRTHKFEKVIVSEGRYRTYDAKTGKYTFKDVTSDDISEMAETFGKMKERGLKVPAPWKHDLDITFESGDGGLLEDSTKNAGFWDSLMTRINPKTNKTELVGTVEVPGDPDNPDTPAGKVGTSVKDTSIYLRRNYTMTDDSGDSFENAPMHIALVTHPIEPNQENFELLESDDSYLAMSELVLDNEVSDLSDLLAKVAGVFLPANTSLETLAPNLRIALNQLALVQKRSEDTGSGSPNSPENTTFKLEPLIMSMTQEQRKSIVDTKAVNPVTGKPWTLADFSDDPKDNAEVKELQMSLSAMKSSMQDDRRQGYRTRINTLVETGRCPKEVAEAQLYKQADEYTVQFNDGNIVQPALETVLMSLEALPSTVKPKKQGEVVTGEYLSPEGLEDDLSEEEQLKIAQTMMAGL